MGLPTRAERYQELKRRLAASMLAPVRPGEMEFYTGAGVLAYQLALAEKMVEAGHLAASLLAGRVDDPFVWGYTFGLAAWLSESAGWARGSSDSDRLITKLHQEVWVRMSAAEVARRSGVAAKSASFAHGMARGSHDGALASRLASNPTSGLVQFLATGQAP